MTPLLPIADDRPIWDTWLASLWLPAVTAAMEIGIVEALAPGALSTTALSARLDLRPQRCLILLRMLDSLGLLLKHEDTYQLSHSGRAYLLKDSPFYWGHVWIGGAAANPYHVSLCEAVRSAPTAPATKGTPADSWESGQLGDELANQIARFMNSHSMAPAYGLARDATFRSVRRLLDVGGGSGCFAIALAQHNPQIHCTVMDLQPMCAIAGDYIAAASVADRVDTLSVDMFRQPWPQGYDALFFSNIFHDWSPEVCAQLAAKAFAALAGGGRIYLHEMLVDDTGAQPRTAAAFSLLMLARTKGQQFTFGELREILEGAGFVGIQTAPSYGYYSRVIGHKPGASPD